MEGVSKGIKNLVKNLSDVNEGVAENAASIASANKQTFSGFLARSKLRKTLEKADTAELQKKTQQVARAEKANAKAEAAVAEKQKLIEEEVNANKKIADIREKIAILNASKENASTAEQLKIQDQINSQTSAIAAEANAIQQTHANDLGELVAKQKQKNDALDKRMGERTALEKEFNNKLAEASTSQEFDQFSGALKDLTGGTIDLSGWADSAVKTFDNIGTVFTTLKGGATKLGGLLTQGFGAITAGLGKVFAPITAMLKAGFTALKTAVMPFLAAMYATAATLLATAGAFLVANAPIIAIVLGVLLLAGLLIWGAMKLYESSETFREVIGVVMDWFGSIVSSIGDIFGGFYDFFVGLFTGDFDLMFQGVKDIFGGLWDLIKSPFKMIGDFFKSVFDIDIWAILRRFAEKILPKWLVNKIFGDKGKGSDPKPEGQPIDVNQNIDEDGNELTDNEKYAQERKQRKAAMEKFNAMSEDEKQAYAKKMGIKLLPKSPVQTVASEALQEPEPVPVSTQAEREEEMIRRGAEQATSARFDKKREELEARDEAGEMSFEEYESAKMDLELEKMEAMADARMGKGEIADAIRAEESALRGGESVGLGASETMEESNALMDKVMDDWVTGEGFDQRAVLKYDDVDEGLTMEERRAKGKSRAEEIAELSQESKQAGNQAVITTVNAPTTNAANTSISTSVPTPRDTDPTGSRLAAVPA